LEKDSKWWLSICDLILSWDGALHVILNPAILIIEVRYIDEEKGKLYYFNKFLKNQTQTNEQQLKTEKPEKLPYPISF
jgi:hypothetical protein